MIDALLCTRLATQMRSPAAADTVARSDGNAIDAPPWPLRRHLGWTARRHHLGWPAWWPGFRSDTAGH